MDMLIRHTKQAEQQRLKQTDIIMILSFIPMKMSNEQLIQSASDPHPPLIIITKYY